MNKFYDFTFQSGDVLLVHNFLRWHKPMTWIGALIRYFNKCYYHHVAMVVEIWGELFVIESTGKGVVISKPLKQWIAEIEARRHFAVKRLPDLTPEHCRTVLMRAFALLGNRYDFISLFWYQLRYQLFGTWRGRTKEKASARMYCSELIGYAYREQFPAWWQTAPREIYQNQTLHLVYQWKVPRYSLSTATVLDSDWDLPAVATRYGKGTDHQTPALQSEPGHAD